MQYCTKGVKMPMILIFLLQLVAISLAQSDASQSLPFIELGTNVAGTVSLPAQNDGVSGAITVEPASGIAFGNTTQTAAYVRLHIYLCKNPGISLAQLEILMVSTDGYISFGRSLTCCPALSTNTSSSDYIVAPFIADTNIRSGQGNVSYEVHTLSRSPTLLSRVNRFIRQQEQNSFAGTWMLLVEWMNVPQSGQTNTFQGIVITNGFQSFTVFTYRCGSMQWSGNAVIGFKANSKLSRIHQFSGANASSIACQNSPRNIWSNVVYQLHLMELPFLSLDQNRTYLSSEMEDHVSNSIAIPQGFPFGNSNQTSIYVSTNGILSFGQPFPYHSPHFFPGTNFYSRDLVAPFWTDNDITEGVGEVSYQVYSILFN